MELYNRSTENAQATSNLENTEPFYQAYFNGNKFFRKRK